MRPIAFALLLLSATACPAFASDTLIEAKLSTFGCQFSATLGLFQELSTASEEASYRILDTGHCLPIDAHQRFTVIRDLPSAYVALKDTQQDDQWVVVFVRKTRTSTCCMAVPTTDPLEIGTESTVRAASRGGFRRLLARAPPQPASDATVDKAHQLSDCHWEGLGAAR